MKPLHLTSLILFLVGAIWALTRSDRVVREIQASYYSAISPFLRAGSAMETRARAFLWETKHSKELEAELSILRPEVGRLQLFEERCRELEKENQHFRSALGFKERTRFDVVAARLIRRNPANWWEFVDIDAGSERGIGLQLAVLSNDGLVGQTWRIDNSGDRSSVLLLTDEKCQVSAWVEGSSEVGILSGQRGFQGEPLLRLRFLSETASIRQGQRVLTTGRGGIFQPNILLGEIQSVERGVPNSEAIVRPSVDFANLSSVFVVLSADS